MSKNRYKNWSTRQYGKFLNNIEGSDSVEESEISMVEVKPEIALEPADGKYPATIVEPHKEVKEENKVKRVERMIAKALTHNKPKVGVTRKDKSKSKNSGKIEKNSRQKNSQIANKKSRPTGSKKRK